MSNTGREIEQPGHVKGRAVYRTASGEEKERATIYLPRELHKKAKIEAVGRRCSVSDLVSDLVSERLGHAAEANADNSEKRRNVSWRDVLARMNSDTSLKGIRDRAIIALIYWGRLRPHQVVAMDIEDLDLVSGFIDVETKGAAAKNSTPISREAVSALLKWVSVRKLKLPMSGPVFVNLDNGHKMHRLTTNGINAIVMDRGCHLSLRMSPEQVRHAAADDAKAKYAEDPCANDEIQKNTESLLRAVGMLSDAVIDLRNRLDGIEKSVSEVVTAKRSHAANTRDAMLRKASKGEYTDGHVPYGYKIVDDGTCLAMVDDEQRVIDEARKLRDKGLSLRAIGRELERLGFRSRVGRGFGAKQISDMTIVANTKEMQ